MSWGVALTAAQRLICLEHLSSDFVFLFSHPGSSDIWAIREFSHLDALTLGRGPERSQRKLAPFLAELLVLSISSGFVISSACMHAQNHLAGPFAGVHLTVHRCNDSRLRACLPGAAVSVKASDIRFKGSIFTSISGKLLFLLFL